MRFRVLACDYDATIAVNRRVGEGTREALRAVRDSGRRLILVTGRTGAELAEVFDGNALFDRVVLENGAVVVDPGSGAERLLAAPIPPELVSELRSRNVQPVILGKVICSTSVVNRDVVREAIDSLGLVVDAVTNRDSLMVVPHGIDKSIGLTAALSDLGEQLATVVAVGDGQNDIAMLDAAGAAVAVANALDEVKRHADVVLEEPGEGGIRQLCRSLTENDLADLMGAARSGGAA